MTAQTIHDPINRRPTQSFAPNGLQIKIRDRDSTREKIPRA